jgi:hypothetical protein
LIAITNNAASIQLNGDQNVTIVKRDVTKVQSIGTNVLVVRKINGIERKTLIPFSSVNIPQSFSTAQALADYISSILGGFDTSSFVENSNGTYVAQVITSPFIIPDTDVELVDTASNFLSNTPLPSAVQGQVIAPDGVVTIENTNQTFQVNKSVLSGGVATEILPDTTYQINVNGNPVAPFDLPTLENNTININWTY